MASTLLARSSKSVPVLIAVVLLVVGLSFAAASVLTEGALHPLIQRRATDTAALAYNIARSTGANVRKVTLVTKDHVSLGAWWLTPVKRTGRAVVICHGVADSAYGALGYSLLFLKNDYSVLVPESRGHGESQGYVTYGVLEGGDIVAWLQWLKDQGVKNAFGFGESLGGAILLQSLGSGACFRAVVAESSYSSFKEVAEERVGRVTGGLIAAALVNEGLLYADLRYGVNLYNARPAVAIRNIQVPVLLIHGLADEETIPENSKRIARANSKHTKLWLVPAAKHTGAYAARPQEFETRVLEWFANASDK